MRSTPFVAPLLVAAALASWGACAWTAEASAAAFSRSLAMGASGSDVLLLQQLLNKSPDTAIAVAGPGSAGQETGYFGGMTRAAVVQFQEKHAREILFPNGLSAGTGIVGPSTQAVLNKIAMAVVSPAAPAVPVAAASPASVPATPAVGNAPSQNPNAKNLDKILAAIDRVNAKKGIPPEKTAAFKAAVTREMLSTTTDLKQQFLKMVKDDAATADASMSPLARAFYDTVGYVAKLVAPARAQAAVGSPFGGAVVGSFYCACSDNWDVFIEPLPPTFVEELSYVPESQAFLSYNIPMTEWLLGQYVPGTGVCLEPGTPCEGGPTEGTISPMTGSSPL